MKEKVKKKILFKICRENHLRNLGINLAIEMKDLYAESCKSLIKEIKDDLKNRYLMLLN